MKHSTDYPPNYRRILEVLGEHKTAVYCYGDTLYNPHGRTITPDLEHHESIHSQQQGDNPEYWCELYLTDPQFRIKAEVEAYGSQYAYAVKRVTDKKMLKWLIHRFASELSSSCYDTGITYGAAYSKIRNFAKSNPQ